jgi:hypothetical protein
MLVCLRRVTLSLVAVLLGLGCALPHSRVTLHSSPAHPMAPSPHSPDGAPLPPQAVCVPLIAAQPEPGPGALSSAQPLPTSSDSTTRAAANHAICYLMMAL